MATASNLLEVRQVSKRFPGVQALDRVSLTLRAGEVLAVVGENGAGKSTLMKILAGIYQPDGGTLLLDGHEVRWAGVADALAHGVSLIHQELNLAENLSVVANLFLGREALWAGPLGLLDEARMDEAARRLLDRVGLKCDPQVRVDRLSTGQRQLVEIAHALALSSRILIMDEPTSSLTQKDTEKLFEVIAELKRSGVAIVYISHRLGEVKEIADRALVLRDGRNSGELARADITHDALVRLMVGRELRQFFQKQPRALGELPASAVPPEAITLKENRFTSAGPPTASGHRPPEGAFTAQAPRPRPAPRLEVRDLRYRGPAGVTPPVSFALWPGEVVGLAGLVGAGRTELAEALFGLRPIVSGEVLLDRAPVRLRSPRAAVAAGLALVPEDRRYHGLVVEDSVRNNVALPNLDRLSFLRLVSARREAELARQTCDRLRVRTPGVEQRVGLLSGGNQQKVVLGKWLARSPRVLLFDEPTRGIDVGAKSEIYALMDRLAGEGMAVLMISSDLEEVLGMSDRVLVLHQGRLAGELPRAGLSEEAIMHLAVGGRRP